MTSTWSPSQRVTAPAVPQQRQRRRAEVRAARTQRATTRRCACGAPWEAAADRCGFCGELRAAGRRFRLLGGRHPLAWLRLPGAPNGRARPRR